MVFTLPIYYTKEYKTKPSETILVGMNKWNTIHYQLKNSIKQAWQADLLKACKGLASLNSPFKVHYKLYYKNPNSDGSNVIALSEKIFLDAIQQANLVTNDNVLVHLGSSWEVAGCDKSNPRVEITISAIP